MHLARSSLSDDTDDVRQHAQHAVVMHAAATCRLQRLMQCIDNWIITAMHSAVHFSQPCPQLHDGSTDIRLLRLWLTVLRISML